MALTYKVSYSYANDFEEHYADFGACKASPIRRAKQLFTSANLSGLFVFSYNEAHTDDFSDIVYFDQKGVTTKHLNWVQGSRRNSSKASALLLEQT